MTPEEAWKVVREIGAVIDTTSSLPVALSLTAVYLFIQGEIDTPRAKIIRDALNGKINAGQ